MYWTRRQLLKTGALGALGATIACAETSIPVEEVTQGVLEDAPVIDAGDYAARIENARRLMGESSIDAIFIECGTSLQYFSGVNWWASERTFGILVPRDGETAAVCPAFEEGRAREQLGEDYKVYTWHEHESPYALIKTALADQGLAGGTIGMEERVRFFIYDGLRKEMPSATFVSADPVTAGCRIIKSKKEMELQRIANGVQLKVYAAVLTNLQEGWKEEDTSRAIAAELQKYGIPGGAMALHGENSAYPHGTANRKALTDGTIVLVDGGCRINGYGSDMTRTVVFGKPTDKQKLVFDIVRRAQDAALAAAKVGAPCGSVDDAARKVITDAGYGPDYKYFTHRLGHGIGMDGHEWPYFVRGNTLPLAPGMTFSDEPGIYILGEFGVRLEDIMYIDEDGGKLYTKQSTTLENPFG